MAKPSSDLASHDVPTAAAASSAAGPTASIELGPVFELREARTIAQRASERPAPFVYADLIVTDVMLPAWPELVEVLGHVDGCALCVAAPRAANVGRIPGVDLLSWPFKGGERVTLCAIDPARLCGAGLFKLEAALEALACHIRCGGVPHR